MFKINSLLLWRSNFDRCSPYMKIIILYLCNCFITNRRCAVFHKGVVGSLKVRTFIRVLVSDDPAIFSVSLPTQPTYCNKYMTKIAKSSSRTYPAIKFLLPANYLYSNCEISSSRTSKARLFV